MSWYGAAERVPKGCFELVIVDEDAPFRSAYSNAAWGLVRVTRSVYCMHFVCRSHDHFVENSACWPLSGRHVGRALEINGH